MRKTKVTVLLLLMALTVSLLAGCGGKEEEKTKDGYAKKLYLYNWTEYIHLAAGNPYERSRKTSFRHKASDCRNIRTGRLL